MTRQQAEVYTEITPAYEALTESTRENPSPAVYEDLLTRGQNRSEVAKYQNVSVSHPH